jgi:uncharacterized protein YneR
MEEDIEIPYGAHDEYEKAILNGHGGFGTIYTGVKYHLDYQPHRQDSYTLKCDGVTLFIRRNSDQWAYDFQSTTVFFKLTQNGPIMKFLFGPGETGIFQERLRAAIKNQIKVIKDYEDQLEKVKTAAKKVVKCQLKIDKTISEIINENSRDDPK